MKSIFSKLKSGSVDILCKLIAAAAILMLVLEVATLFTGWMIYIILLPLILGFFSGFVLQGIILKVMKHKKLIDYSWEDSTKYFHLPYAIPTIVLEMAAAIMLNKAIHIMLKRMSVTGQIAYYDEHSLFPVICTLVFLLAACAGIYIQFFPYYRIISINRMFYYLAISLLCAVLAIMLHIDTTLISVFFILFAVCAVIILNQSYIIRTYGNSAIVKLTPSGRLTNMRIVLLCFVLTAFFGIFAFMFINGLYMLIRLLFYSALLWIVGYKQPIRPNNTDQVSQEISKGVFDGDLTNLFSLGLFLFALLGVIVIFIFLRTGAIQSFLRSLWQMLESFIAMFMGGNKYTPEVREVEINYRDTTEKIAKPQGNTARDFTNHHVTLREFNSELASMKSYEEKLSYSYIIMVGIMSEINADIKNTDTPRERAEKIKSSMVADSIDEITDIIELIKYAERSADPAVAESTLSKICTIVERKL